MENTIKIMRIVKIEPLHFPIDNCYYYDAIVCLSVDGGKNFYHCGMGRYCKTKSEALEYKKEIESQEQ